MFHVKFKPHRIWIQEYESAIATGNVPAIVKRVAAVVCIEPQIHKHEHGYIWQLDDTNDWKFDRDQIDKVSFSLAYRYGYGNGKLMLALSTVLEHIFQ